MTVEQADVIDFASIDKQSGNLWLTISDHLPWDYDEYNHLIILRNKIERYLDFIESDKIYEIYKLSDNRNIVINIVGKFPLSMNAENFLQEAQKIAETSGVIFQFTQLDPT